MFNRFNSFITKWANAWENRVFVGNQFKLIPQPKRFNIKGTNLFNLVEASLLERVGNLIHCLVELTKNPSNSKSNMSEWCEKKKPNKRRNEVNVTNVHLRVFSLPVSRVDGYVPLAKRWGLKVPFETKCVHFIVEDEYQTTHVWRISLFWVWNY